MSLGTGRVTSTGGSALPRPRARTFSSALAWTSCRRWQANDSGGDEGREREGGSPSRSPGWQGARAVGHSRSQAPAFGSLPSRRQAEEVSFPPIDCEPRARAKRPIRRVSGRLEMDHELAGTCARGGTGEALLVRDAMEDRAFHKIRKSGCRAEASKLQASGRIVNRIAVFCILNWRIFRMTMMKRVAPTAPSTLAITGAELRPLDRLIPDRTG